MHEFYSTILEVAQRKYTGISTWTAIIPTIITQK